SAHCVRSAWPGTSSCPPPARYRRCLFARHLLLPGSAARPDHFGYSGSMRPARVPSRVFLRPVVASVVALVAFAAAASSIGAGAGAVADDAAQIAVHRVPHGGIQPEVATGRDGIIHLVYFTGTPAGGDLFYV